MWQKKINTHCTVICIKVKFAVTLIDGIYISFADKCNFCQRAAESAIIRNGSKKNGLLYNIDYFEEFSI